MNICSSVSFVRIIWFSQSQAQIVFQLACALCGNPSFPLDAKELALISLVKQVKPKFMLVDLTQLEQDLDLTDFDSLEVIVTFGKNSEKVISANCTIVSFET